MRDAWFSEGKLPFAAQPGLFSNQYDSRDNSIVAGTETGNQKLVELVKADARALGLNFQEYETGMNGGYVVLLVVSPTKQDYHWYRQEMDGTWSHKMGIETVVIGVKDSIKDAKKK